MFTSRNEMSSRKSISHIEYASLKNTGYSLALKPNASQLLVPCENDNNIYMFDRNDPKKSSSVDVGEWLVGPSAVTVNTSEIFVAGAEKSDGVAVFDHDLSFKRKFAAPAASLDWSASISMAADESFVYIAHQSNRLTKWSCETGEMAGELEVANPGNVRVGGDWIYVISEVRYETDGQTKKLKSGLNCVLVVDKHSLTVKRKVSVDNWTEPTALHLSCERLYVAARRIGQNGLASKQNVLFVFDSSERLVEQMDFVGVDEVLDMVVVENELFLIEYNEFWTLVKFQLP